MTSKEWSEWWVSVQRHPEETVAGASDIIVDLATVEKERDRQKDAAESWKDSYRECLARAEAAEATLKRIREGARERLEKSDWHYLCCILAAILEVGDE